MQYCKSLTKTFLITDFVPRAYLPIHQDTVDNLRKLAQQLEAVQDEMNTKLCIRNDNWEETYHKLGLAADFYSHRAKPIEIFNTMNDMIKQGQIKRGCLYCGDRYVSYDISGRRTRKTSFRDWEEEN